MVVKKASKSTRKRKSNIKVIPEPFDNTDAISKEIKGRRYFVVLLEKDMIYSELISNKIVTNKDIIAACQAIIHNQLANA